MTTESVSSSDGGTFDHDYCLMCGRGNPRSLGLRFMADRDGVAHGRFRPSPDLQGYRGVVHGGVIASVLDAAMTHCLFLRDVEAVTGDLRVRYVASVPCDADLTVSARVVASSRRLFRLRAEIRDAEEVLAWAEATFVRRQVGV